MGQGKKEVPGPLREETMEKDSCHLHLQRQPGHNGIAWRREGY